mmetsp:Transcript_13664/g.36336  ORF Transcript_13664/g.36336 Transcript_13664/m.36336 type:complete len:246 (-) Transcript_13664:719-1456(-)
MIPKHVFYFHRGFSDSFISLSSNSQSPFQRVVRISLGGNRDVRPRSFLNAFDRETTLANNQTDLRIIDHKRLRAGARRPAAVRLSGLDHLGEVSLRAIDPFWSARDGYTSRFDGVWCFARFRLFGDLHAHAKVQIQAFYILSTSPDHQPDHPIGHPSLVRLLARPRCGRDDAPVVAGCRRDHKSAVPQSELRPGRLPTHHRVHLPLLHLSSLFRVREHGMVLLLQEGDGVLRARDADMHREVVVR